MDLYGLGKEQAVGSCE